MALHAIRPLNDAPPDRQPDKVPAVPNCPICDGRMEVVYHRNNQQVSVCTDCHSGLTVPATAMQLGRIKREAKLMRNTGVLEGR